MNRSKATVIFSTSYLLLLLFNACIGFPMARTKRNGMFKLIPNETSFPNGTIIGRYSYMDQEGNPVEVKYYADDSSYGVELNSVKIFTGKGDKEKAPTDTAKNDQNQFDYADADKYPSGSKYPEEKSVEKKYEWENDFDPESTNKRIDTAHSKSHNKDSDYEILYKPNVVADNAKYEAKKHKVYTYNFETEPRKSFPGVSGIVEDKPQRFCQSY